MIIFNVFAILFILVFKNTTIGAATNENNTENNSLELATEENDMEPNSMESLGKENSSKITRKMSSEAQKLGKAVTDILNDIQKDYDNRVRPNYGSGPVEVGITMFILSISSVSEVDMDFTFSCYFRQMWRDPRLKFEGPPGVKNFYLGAEYLKILWIPDTFFTNEKKSYFHTATTSNEFLRISSDGDVLRSTRLTITASCPMDLRYFPMDRQLCRIEIESYRYSLSDVIYVWANGSKTVGIAEGVSSLPQFRVIGHRKKTVDVSLFSGNYSRLAWEIQFVRSMGYYLIQIYIPSGLIVIISWLSFWLSRNATTARVALGVTTVLTMATLMSSVNATLPKISYIKSMDVYLAACFLTVFASLIENAVVGYMKKRIQIRKNIYLSWKHNRDEQKLLLDQLEYIDADDDNYDLNETSKHVGTSKHVVTVENTNDEETPAPDRSILEPEYDIDKFYGITPFDIDKCSRILFPVSFLIFNILYWMIYLTISDVVEHDLVPFGAQN